MGDSAATSSDTSESNSMVNGMLSLPQLGIALAMVPGRDVLHLQLGETIHVPDSTRDTKNWSWVHGP